MDCESLGQRMAGKSLNGRGMAGKSLNGTQIEENRPKLARKSLNDPPTSSMEGVPFHLIPSFFKNVDYLIKMRYTYLTICVKTLVRAKFRLPFRRKLATRPCSRAIDCTFSGFLASQGLPATFGVTSSAQIVRRTWQQTGADRASDLVTDRADRASDLATDRRKSGIGLGDGSASSSDALRAPRPLPGS